VIKVAFFLGVFFAAHRTAVAEDYPQKEDKDNIDSIVDTALSNYVRLTAVGREKTGNATGVAISPKLVVTCYHFWSKVAGWFDRFLGGPQGDKHEEYGRVLMSAPELDLMMLEFGRESFHPSIRFAEKVSLGEYLVSISNAFGQDGIYHKFQVVKIDANYIFVQFPNPIAPQGASGAGVYNRKGELVGIIKGPLVDNKERYTGYLALIPARKIKVFVEEMAAAYKTYKIFKEQDEVFLGRGGTEERAKTGGR